MSATQHNFTHLLPFEGAIATRQALDVLQWTYMETDAVRRGLFGPITVPFHNEEVQFRDGTTHQIPWGRYEVKGLGKVQCEVGETEHDSLPCFSLQGLELKNEDKWHELLKTIEAQHVRLYQGRALVLKFDEGHGQIRQPQEMLVSRGLPLVFNPDVREAVEANIFTPITQTQACRALGVPMKRGIILEGSYGMGKSLTAAVTAALAVDNGWTFLMVPRPQLLVPAFKMAERLSPCVIFAEDVDEFLRNGRDSINDLLNTIDGVESKSSDIMTIYSTNFVGSIDRAFLRPGRADVLITITPPTAETVGRLIETYGGQSTPELIAKLTDASPAIIREAVERGKLLSVQRRVPFTTNLIEEAAYQLDRQRQLMEPTQTTPQALTQAFEHMINSSVKRALAESGF